MNNNSMIDLCFLCNYKGMLYPLKLKPSGSIHTPCSPGFSCFCSTSPVRSLVDLCAAKIVEDASTTAKAVDVVPSELSFSLMKAALLNTRDRAIEVLISKWPWRGLSLNRLAEYMFTELKSLYSDGYVGERMRRGVKYTTCIAHTFVECLKKRCPTKLKYLDLTGYPAAEVIVNYLASHVLLVYNESQQNEIISMYNEVAASLPEESRQKYKVETTLPEECFVISIDAFVQTPDTHMELSKALKVSRKEQCRFRLRINKLDLTCLGASRIFVLLEQTDPEYLTGLCLQYNALNCDGLTTIAPQLKLMTSLTGLDLSCNNIAVANNHQVAELLGETLAFLPNLCRLDLSNNRLKNKLRIVLGKMDHPLKHIELSGCGLSDMDLQYLSTSTHVGHLQELDLSENNIGRSFGLFCTLLNIIGKNLITLETEDCWLNQSQFTHLFHTSSKCLKALRFWNMSRNGAPCNSDIFIEDMKRITTMPVLETFLVSYPSEILNTFEDEPEELNHQKGLFQEKLHSTLSEMCRRSNHTPINVVLVNS